MVRCMRTLAGIVLALCALLPVGQPANAALDVNGNVYTSPIYDYQIQWSDPWYFFDETSESGVDTLVLATDTSDASFIFAFAPGMTLQDLIDVSISEALPDVSNIQPMLDDQGVPVAGINGDQEWALYTADQLLPDGSTIQFMQYFNFRSLEGGVILAMSVVTVSYFWNDSLLQSWHDLADTALVSAAPGPPIATEAAPTVPAAPTAPSGPTEIPSTLKPTMPAAPAGAGEPAPAFAAGPWRIAVRAVDLGETIDYLGLEFVDGSQWVVVYADVTNWSAADATLDVATMTLATAGGAIAPNPAGTQSTATLLGLEPANGSSVVVPAGGATRLALAYSVPVSESELILELEGTQLPLQDAVGQQLDVTDLSTIATPPAMEQGIFTGFEMDSDGATRVSLEMGGQSVLVPLAGVEIPWLNGCVDMTEVSVEFLSLVGKQVLIESDPALESSGAVYVWIVDAAGNHTSLNQQIIADGFAIEGDLPESARFGAWLEQTDSVAEANSIGLWSACAGQL